MEINIDINKQNEPEFFLKNLLERWTKDFVCLPELCEYYLNLIQMDKKDKLYKVILTAADQTQKWQGYGYHGVKHHVEVICSMITILQFSKFKEPLSTHDLSLLLLACVVHDLEYVPPGNKGTNFFLEEKAANILNQMMINYKINSNDRTKACVLVLATESKYRFSVLEKLSDGMGTDENYTKTIPSQLKPLISDYKLLQMACVISDADLLCSVIDIDFFITRKNLLDQENKFLNNTNLVSWNNYKDENKHENKDKKWFEQSEFFLNNVAKHFISSGAVNFDKNLTQVKNQINALSISFDQNTTNNFKL